MVGLESSPLLGNLRGPQQTTNKGAKPYVIVAAIVVMMSLFGTLFSARGGSQLSPLSDYSLGAEDAQPFVNVLGVEQGQCDFVTCDVTDEGPSNAHMYSFVDDCRVGGAGCVGTTGGCRHCLVGEVTREHHPDFPVCPPCVCEHHGLSTEGCAGGALPEPGTDPVETSDEATQTEAPPSPSPPPSPFPPPNPCRRSVTVARSDAVGAGWGMNLRFSCLGTSPIDIGQGKAGSTETTVFVDNINPDACPVSVDQNNWDSSETNGDTFSVKVSTGCACRRAVTVYRSDAVGEGWGMNLHFACTGAHVEVGGHLDADGAKEKIVFVEDLTPYACPSSVDKNNWSGEDTNGDTFSVEVSSECA